MPGSLGISEGIQIAHIVKHSLIQQCLSIYHRPATGDHGEQELQAYLQVDG